MMLTIISLREQVFIRVPFEEVTIYPSTFFKDSQGNIFDEMPTGEKAALPVQILGHLIFESLHKRYIFKNVHASYEKAMQIIGRLCIGPKQDDMTIVLEDLPGVDFVTDGFTVEVLH